MIISAHAVHVASVLPLSAKVRRSAFLQNRYARFQRARALVAKYGSRQTLFARPSAAAAGSVTFDSMYVSNSLQDPVTGDSKDTISKIDKTGAVVQTITPPPDDLGGYLCRGILPDSANNVNLFDFLGPIYRYSAAGTRMGSPYPSGLSPSFVQIDAQNNIYALDDGLTEVAVTRYDASGSQQVLFLLPSIVNGYVNGFAIDGAGNVYISDQFTNSTATLRKYSKSGVLLGTLWLPGGDGGQLATDSVGSVYVIHIGADVIGLLKYNSAGSVVARLPVAEAYDVPISVTTDVNNNVYIASENVGSSNYVVTLYDANANFIRAFVIPAPHSSSAPYYIGVASSRVLMTAVANVSASSGGTVALADGTAITFDPGALASNAAVTLREDDHSRITPTSGYENVGNSITAWLSAPNPALRTVAAARPLFANASPRVRIIHNLSKEVGALNNGVRIENGYIQSPDGTSTQFAELTDTLNSVVQASVDPHAFSSGSKVSFGVSQYAVRVAAGHPGLRYVTNDGNYAWQSTPVAPGASCEHPVLLLHGVFSNVEATYLPDTLFHLAIAGSYDCMIGYDYDWTQSPATIAPGIISAVKAYFGGKTIQNIDVVAHSYGGVVATVVIPGLPVNEVQNFTAYGAPFNGSYLTSPEITGTLVSRICETMGLSAGDSAPFAMVGNLTSSMLQASGWVHTFSPGQSDGYIRTMLTSGRAPINVLLVAGTHEYISTVFGVAIPWEASLFSRFGIVVELPNDGVVTATRSALYSLVIGQQSPHDNQIPANNGIRLLYGADHTHLVPDASIVDTVDKSLKYVYYSGATFTNGEQCIINGSCFVHSKGEGVNYYAAPIAAPAAAYTALMTSSCLGGCVGSLKSSTVRSLPSYPTQFSNVNSTWFTTGKISQQGSGVLRFTPVIIGTPNQYVNFQFDPQCMQPACPLNAPPAP